jgi:DNA-binding NarL/FixJ family response regulator
VLAVALAAGWWAATRALGRLLHVAPVAAGIPSLSRRESDVLALVADGLRDADIAARLHLSERTVESHVRNIFRKLGLEADDGANRRVLAARSWVEANNSGLARISAGARTD